MTPVSPFLTRSALALAAGIALATALVAVAPGTYFDLVEWRLADLPWSDGLPQGAVTPVRVVTDLLMAGFVFLLGKEMWETLTIERSGMAGRQSLAPAIAVIGGLCGAALVWLGLSALIETAEEAAGAPGWTVPLGCDVVLAYAFGRRLFGSGHPALQILLFVTIAADLAALLLAGLTNPGGDLRPAWMAVAVLLPCLAWVGLTRPAAAPDATERVRARAQSVWPWIALGVPVWGAVAASGLPPALGLLPLLPALPPASRSFGLFAYAEGFLTDPANRVALVLRPASVAVLFLFGLTHGALDLRAAAPTTWVTLGALWIGKPLGLALGLFVALSVLGLPRPRLDARDLIAVAGLSAIGFTAPSLVMETALPGGAMQEAARLGLGLSLLAGPMVLWVFRAGRNPMDTAPRRRT
ncbi:MAG: Na+/H+ antiporter NhaA [Gemmobacter sp.]